MNDELVPDVIGKKDLNGPFSSEMLERAPTVLIWQANGGVGHDLAFMYKPVMATLLNGFSDVPTRVQQFFTGQRPRVVHGYGSHAFSKMKQDATSSLNQLRVGDVFIWIGIAGSELPRWHVLKQRGIRTIYYQTEPADGCFFAGSKPVELWEFSVRDGASNARPWHRAGCCSLPLQLTVSTNVPCSISGERSGITSIYVHRSCRPASCCATYLSATMHRRRVCQAENHQRTMQSCVFLASLTTRAAERGATSCCSAFLAHV